MARDFDVILFTGIPDNNKTELLTELTQNAHDHDENWMMIRSWDLIANAYRTQGLRIPNPHKILNQHPDSQYFVMQDAFRRLDDFVQEEARRRETSMPDKVLISGHGQFFYEYAPIHAYPAISAENVQALSPDMIVNVQFSPWEVQKRNQTTAWHRFEVKDFARWSADEYETSLKLAQSLAIPATGKRNFAVVGGSAEDYNVAEIAKIIRNPAAPIIYPSYSITGKPQDYQDAVLDVFDQIDDHFAIIHHRSTHFSEFHRDWEGGEEALIDVELRMLLANSDLNVAVYLKAEDEPAHVVSSGAQDEGNYANAVAMMPTVLCHPAPEKLSLFKTHHYDHIFKNPADLVKHLAEHRDDFRK